MMTLDESPRMGRRNTLRRQVTAQIDDMKLTIESVWKDNRMKATISMVLMFFFAVYNSGFTFYTAAFAWKGEGSDGRALNPYLRYVVGFEAMAQVYHIVWCLIHMCALAFQEQSHSASQALELVRSLEMVGTFSFFMFLPGPKKVMYWIQVRHIAWEAYVKKSLALRMTREGTSEPLYFSPRDEEARRVFWTHISEKLKCNHRCQDYAICQYLVLCFKVFLSLLALLAWFLERAVKPCFFILFIVGAFPAVILKLSNLPNLNLLAFNIALLYQISPYLGIILQATRTWAIREVEHAAVCRFIMIIHDGEEEPPNVRTRLKLYSIVVDAISGTLCRWEAVCMLSLLDNALLADILRKHHGQDAPAYVENPTSQERHANSETILP